VKRARAHLFQVASHAGANVPCAINIGEDVVGAQIGMQVAAEDVGVFGSEVGLDAAQGELLADAGVVLHGLAGGDGVVVLAPLVAVGRIVELIVEAFVGQRVVGKGAAEHGGKYEGGGMNYEGLHYKG